MDARRLKRDRRTALKLFGKLQLTGFDGGYAMVKAFVPLHFELGETFQFDWSEEHLLIGGVRRKIMAAHLKLCASQAFILQAYPMQNHKMLFDVHTCAFTALGGITRRGIYDSMKPAVDKVRQGKLRTVNRRFSAMASHYLFDPDFCNVASGWEKGVVEKNVQDSRRCIWQALRHPDFDDLTIAEMLEHEQPCMMPMVTPFDGYVETLGKVSRTCLAIEDCNRYSAPCELVRQMVSIRTYPERLDFVAHDAMVASHPRSFERNKTHYDW